jgi:hypothetical protein
MVESTMKFSIGLLVIARILHLLCQGSMILKKTKGNQTPANIGLIIYHLIYFNFVKKNYGDRQLVVRMVKTKQ